MVRKSNTLLLSILSAFIILLLPASTASAALPTIERVSIADDGTQTNQFSVSGNITDDGRYVVFHSDATTLIPNDTNSRVDVFLYDRETDTIELISKASNGDQSNGDSYSPDITPDGRYIAFNSSAEDLVPIASSISPDIFVYDRQTETNELISFTHDGTTANNGSSNGLC